MSIQIRKLNITCMTKYLTLLKFIDYTFESRTDFYLVSVLPKMDPNFCYVDLYEFIDKKTLFFNDNIRNRFIHFTIPSVTAHIGTSKYQSTGSLNANIKQL